MENDGPQMPEKFGKYIVKEQLGEGGMGVVWLAEDPFLGEYVAIKELRPGLSAARLQAEAQVIRSLNKHKTVVQVYDFEPQSESGNAYYVMEYMSNGWLGKGSASIKIAPKKCIEILRPIADAIDHAHRKGILHRDIKPSNILFDEDNKPRLSDFSIAYWEPSPGAAHLAGTSDSPRTQIHPVKGFVGTPEYAAPESFDEQEPTAAGDMAPPSDRVTSQAQKHTAASDIYSLAVVAFEMLTGVRPLSIDPSIDESEDQTVRLEAWKATHQSAPPIDISKYGDKNQFHKHYKDVFKKALDKDPAKRYQTAKGFIKALEDARIRGPVSEVTLKELPRLLLGRSDEDMIGPSAAAYRNLQRKGVLTLVVWLFVLIGVIILWRFGPLRVPSHQASITLWELLIESNWRVFSSRLLGSGVFLGLVAGLLLAFPLCRLLAGAATRAGSDRYWKEGEIRKLEGDLKALLSGVDKPAAGSRSSRKKARPVENGPSPVRAPVAACVIWDQAEHPSPATTSAHQNRAQPTPSLHARRKASPVSQNPMWLHELYRYLDFKPRKLKSNQHGIDDECKDLIGKCKDGAKLFRLRSYIDRKTQSPASAIDPARGPRRLLKTIEVFDILGFAVLILCAVPAISYWAENPETAFTPWAAAGIIALWFGGLAAMWLILSYETKPKR